MATVQCDVDSFDNIQLCVPDVHSVPRGKVVSGETKRNLTKENFQLFNGIAMIGPTGLGPRSVKEFCATYRNNVLRPCVDTLIPWPWINTGKRRAGNVLCDVYRPDGTPDLNCPRQQLRHQLDALQDEHGLVIKTAFEYEFIVYHKNTLEPLGNERNHIANLRILGEHQDLLSDLRDVLEAMGVRITAMATESDRGQWELNTEPFQGITGADVGFYVKNAVKGFLNTRGYHATFMSKPTLDMLSNGLHLNHSLWKASSSSSSVSSRTTTSTNKAHNNVLAGTEPAVEPLSPTAKHWIAGLLAHAPALCGIMCPTINCYRRLRGVVTPNRSIWGMENRRALVRARETARDNVFLENRLPSAAASPYLALAATVAAGRDGLQRRLKCPDPMDEANASELPRTLEQALAALEDDRELSALMGEEFVRCYVQSKQEVELAPYDSQTFDSEDQRIAFERDMYFSTL